jgi:hypothetical protein
MDLVSVIVDVIPLTRWSKRCISGAKNQGPGDKDHHNDQEDKNYGGDENTAPFSQRPPSLYASGKSLFFLSLAPGDDSIGDNGPDSHQGRPSYRSDSDPAFLKTETWNSKYEDKINNQKDGDYQTGYPLRFIRGSIEEDSHEKISHGQSGVCEDEEARATCM